MRRINRVIYSDSIQVGDLRVCLGIYRDASIWLGTKPGTDGMWTLLPELHSLAALLAWQPHGYVPADAVDAVLQFIPQFVEEATTQYLIIEGI